jgi:hypothetical protein
LSLHQEGNGLQLVAAKNNRRLGKLPSISQEAGILPEFPEAQIDGRAGHDCSRLLLSADISKADASRRQEKVRKEPMSRHPAAQYAYSLHLRTRALWFGIA